MCGGLRPASHPSPPIALNVSPSCSHPGLRSQETQEEMTEPVSVPARPRSPGHTLRLDSATAAALSARGCRRLGTTSSDVSLSSYLPPSAPLCPGAGLRWVESDLLGASPPPTPHSCSLSLRLPSTSVCGIASLLLPQSPQFPSIPLTLPDLPSILLFCPCREAPNTNSLFPLR